MFKGRKTVIRSAIIIINSFNKIVLILLKKI